jgi:hypothetical protein
VRDLAFWEREAQKRIIQNRMSAIQACRLATAKDSAYQNVMSDLQRSLAKIEHGEEVVIKESWKALKIMKRG